MFKMFQYRIYSDGVSKGDLWKTLSLKLLQKDDRLAIVETLIKDNSFSTEEERIVKFSELTGDSRTTYFRLKKKLEI